eukprot:CAMPEP_0202459502 /NCGR_PEP_ID=MMETSP1360-20130828/36037_1 /ASSEMBLY_ACC=CAM_ASM_000848 /TAXON_ID=515479 /ORGANISM="Licmophora paradoxa, Strain CCMP2313" /LENGTH=112 /DNA_ID=CAMNT_0049080605 /DNA_START=44 /DNA_END=382 /DNA_ORIENTATION=-
MPPAFNLLVTLKFTEEQYLQQFLDFVKPLCDYIKEEEPETLAYEVIMSDQDPLQCMLFERYADKENAFLKIHRSSKAFSDFRPKLKALQEAGHVQLDGHSYLDSMVGFINRS